MTMLATFANERLRIFTVQLPVTMTTTPYISSNLKEALLITIIRMIPYTMQCIKNAIQEFNDVNHLLHDGEVSISMI